MSDHCHWTYCDANTRPLLNMCPYLNMYMCLVRVGHWTQAIPSSSSSSSFFLFLFFYFFIFKETIVLS